MTHNHRELSAPAQLGVAVIALLQLAFASLAAWDLAHRPAKEVRGPKPAWIPALFINWIGPAAYFLVGIKHENR